MRLSARQLENAYCLATSNCASASLAPGFLAAARQADVACLRSQFKLGLSGNDNEAGVDPRVGSDMRSFLPCERDKPFHAAMVRSQGEEQKVM